MNIPSHLPEQLDISISQEMNRSLLNQYNNKIHTLLSADNSSESSWNIYDVLAAEISAYIRRENNLPNDVKGILPEETKTQIKTHVLEHISPEAHRLAQASPESTALTFELWFPKYEDYGTGENVRATIKKSLKSRTLSRDHIKNIVRAFFSSRQGANQREDFLENNPRQADESTDPKTDENKLEYILHYMEQIIQEDYKREQQNK